MRGHLGGEQRTVQTERGRGQDVDALMQIPMAGGGADLIVERELRDTGVIAETVQRSALPAAIGRRPAPATGTTFALLTGQQLLPSAKIASRDRSRDTNQSAPPTMKTLWIPLVDP